MEFQPATTELRCELGESPVYDDRRHALWLADIVGQSLHRLDIASGTVKSWAFEKEVCSLGLCDSDCLVLALSDVVGIFDPESGGFVTLCSIEADNPDTRLNDGKVGPDGAFWVGSADISDNPVKRPLGSLYRVGPDGRVERKVEGLIASNGLAFSPDGTIMFHSDSSGHWLDRWSFDVATGAIADRTRIAEITDEMGRPDGAATDAEGCYWSAGVSAQCLNRFAPDGRLLSVHPLPLAAPTMPCFGGPDMRTLYVTSLRVGRAPELLANYPLSGFVLTGAADIAGSPVGRFRDREA